MTEHEKDTEILKTYVENIVEDLEAGNSRLITGGYIRHTYNENLIDVHCNKIVNKLIDLGYEYTTNHGHGCKDYRFTKKIEL